DGLEIRLRLLPEGDGRISFELSGPTADVHVQGKAEITAGFDQATADLNALRERCSQTISAEEFYAAFAERGLEYGPGFRVIREIRYSNSEVLSAVEVSQEWGEV